MNIPNWLRWVLFFPAGLVASGVAYYIAVIINKVFYAVFWFPFIEYSIILAAYGASAFAFVWCSAKVAPKHSFRVSVIMAIAYGFVVVFLIILELFIVNDASTSWFEALLISIGAIVGAVNACKEFYEERIVT
jgi:hypothetical protein